MSSDFLTGEDAVVIVSGVGWWLVVYGGWWLAVYGYDVSNVWSSVVLDGVQWCMGLW